MKKIALVLVAAMVLVFTGCSEVLYWWINSRKCERINIMKNSIKKPNILFIITDDQGEWAVESEKNRDIKTPNLKRLANQGVTFDEFYCTSPVCSPARASIVTGKIPSCHGVQDWLKKGNLDAYKYPNMAELPGFDMTDKAI